MIIYLLCLTICIISLAILHCLRCCLTSSNKNMPPSNSSPNTIIIILVDILNCICLLPSFHLDTSIFSTHFEGVLQHTKHFFLEFGLIFQFQLIQCLIPIPASALNSAHKRISLFRQYSGQFLSTFSLQAVQIGLDLSKMSFV